MPIRVSYPGVYVEEVPGGQPVASGVSTSSTAFVDYFCRGPMNKAVRVTSMADVQREFGGLDPKSEASYGLKQYFLNGGQEAWVVRAGDGTARCAHLDVTVETPGLAARFQWAMESKGAAKQAQEAAEKAAQRAEDAYQSIDVSSDSALVLEQKSKELRGEATEAATKTRETTAATREAAIQARASSDELAIKIAALAAAAGPVAENTATAAGHSAEAAKASYTAATFDEDVIAAAQVAVERAGEALGFSQTARTIQGAGRQIADTQSAIEAANRAAKSVSGQDQKVQAMEEKDLVAATQGALQAASDAGEAAEQAEQAVQTLPSVLSTLEGLAKKVEEEYKLNEDQQAAVDKSWAEAGKDAGAADAGTWADDTRTAVKKADTDATAAETAEGEAKTKAGEVATAQSTLDDKKKEADDAQKKVDANPEDAEAQTAATAAAQALTEAETALETATKAANEAQTAAEEAVLTASQSKTTAIQALADDAKTQADEAAKAAADAPDDKEKATAAADAKTKSDLLAPAPISTAIYPFAKQASEDAAAAKTHAEDAANALAEAEKSPSRAAMEASIDAQTAVDLESAKGASAEAKRVADVVAAEGEDEPGMTVKAAEGVKTALDVLAFVVKVAGEGAAQLAGQGDGQVGEVVKDANLAIVGASDAAKKALVAAKLAANDAKVAASSVGSAAVTQAAREVVSGTEKATSRIASVLSNGNAVMAQLNKAVVAASQSVLPSEQAAKKAGEGDPNIDNILDAAQAALNAADTSLAAAETVEKAAVAVADITKEATLSTDLAARSATVTVEANEEAGRPPTLRISACNEGIWGNNIQVDLSVQGAEFSLVVEEYLTERGVTRRVSQESYNMLDLEAGGKRYAVDLLNEQSKLIRVEYIGPRVTGAYPEEVAGKPLENGDNGGIADAEQLTGANGALYALDDIRPFIFNLLCLPSVGNMPGGQASAAIAAAHAYCGKKRAFFIVDIPVGVDTTDKMLEWVGEYGNGLAYNMAAYFPRLLIPDPLQDFRARNVGPSGTLAGIYARTDNRRGVWKAPAGINAVIEGAELVTRISDDENGLLNPLGVNVLRSFPVYGNVSWGARTLAGADAISSEWKYLNVRRLMSYVEETLYQNLKWAVFEPNGEDLWSKIRVQVATFLAGLYSQGAFQGTGEGSSYFVVCDGTTTTPVDIDLGVVNVDVGIAPSKPAEFIVLHVQQIAGQTV